jgi:hypothetical protein
MFRASPAKAPACRRRWLRDSAYSRLRLERAVSNRPTNLVLASLSAADLKLLEPHLRALDFQQHKILFEASG